jgi:mannose-6-phosphate isomerase-like protein (cupin superfamily)
MSAYTKKNVSALKDAAEEYGMGDVMSVRFPAKELDAEETGMGHHSLKPGKRQGFGHKHDEAEEVYFVVSGSGRVRLDDETVELEKGDFVRVAPEVMRRFEGGDDGIEFISFGSRHEGDGDIDPGFWAPNED